MKRRGKLVLGLAIVALAALAAGGWYLYRTEIVGRPQFDADLYAADAAATRAGPFSYADYAATLAAYVNDQGMVDYRSMKADHRRLDAFLQAMARLDPETYRSWTDNARIAFWINAYNALTLKAIIDHYPIKPGVLTGLAFPDNSIRQIPGVWTKIEWQVVGRRLTLDRIEHGILRGQDAALAEAFGRFHEPRIHVALVCAAMGCPPLRNEPYTGDRLGEQLDDQARRFLSNSAKFSIDRGAGTVHLSSIFKWFGGDFIKRYGPAEGFTAAGSDAEKAVLAFIAGYLPAEDATYLATGTYRVAYLDYDWSLNEQKRVP